MFPAIVLVGIGDARMIWLPLPTFLLWPLWLLGWVAWALMRVLRLAGHRRLWLALSLSGRMSGLRLDIRSRQGQRIRVRMI